MSQFKVGMTIGKRTLLVKHPKHNVAWFARCECGRISIVNAYVLKKRVLAGWGMCNDCANVARRLPRKCRSCGTTKKERFNNKASECMACNRAACRNGRDEQGRAIKVESPRLRYRTLST